ncbi:MAG: DUF5320 domain-containing protein [Desulfobacterales bacterium]|nr:DUF5320 domain-containing protein [Desulfobacterales bacterium]
MPRYDHTGPEGAGPLTGGGFGNCGDGVRAGGGRFCARNIGGYGGRGRFGVRRRMGRGAEGGRRGRRRFAGPSIPAADGVFDSNAGWLREQARWLTAELERVETRLDELGDPAPVSGESTPRESGA